MTLWTFVTGVSLGVLAGAWLATITHHWVPRSLRKFIRRIYRHVDEPLGARKFENDRRVKLHNRWSFWVSPRWANLLYPRAQLSGAAALPSTRRMGRYVKVSRDRRTITLRYTSEAYANGPNFIEYLEKGRPQAQGGGGLAQALQLEYRAGMFQVAWDRSHDQVSFTRPTAAKVADLERAEDELA